MHKVEVKGVAKDKTKDVGAKLKDYDPTIFDRDEELSVGACTPNPNTGEFTMTMDLWCVVEDVSIDLGVLTVEFTSCILRGSKESSGEQTAEPYIEDGESNIHYPTTDYNWVFSCDKFKKKFHSKIDLDEFLKLMNINYYIPAGALDNATYFSMKNSMPIPDMYGVPEGYQPISESYDLEPSDITFKKPITVFIYYTDEETEDCLECTLTVFRHEYIETDEYWVGIWKPVPTIVDTYNNLLIFHVTQLGTFGFSGMPCDTLVEIARIDSGFGVSAVIENNLGIDIEDINWTISIDGFVLLGRESKGTMDISASGKTIIKSEPILGLDPATITVSTVETSKKVSGFLLGPYVFIESINHHPNTPSEPEGPITGNVGETLYYESLITDPDEDSMEIVFFWGDGTNTGWLGPVASGTTVRNFHSWDSPGVYQVKVKTRDLPDHAKSDWSTSLTIIIGEEENHPPNTPSQPEGPTSGNVGESLHFESYFSDPDGDSMDVMFDWGDGTDTGWIGVVASGTTVGNYHSWDEPGTYQVRTKARDIPYHAESDWSPSLTVTIS